MKKFIFIIISILIFILAFIQAKPPETELLKAFINPNSSTEKNFAKLANLSSNKINIIFESNTPNSLEEMKTPFLKYKTTVDTRILDVYKNYPANFLSPHKIELLKSKNYNELEKEGLEALYNPLGIFIAAPNFDPYLLATDFVINTSNWLVEDNREFNGKYYSLMRIETDDIAGVLQAAQSASEGKIYLSGTPIHSYITSQKSAMEINFICVISTLLLCFLAKSYFKTLKILLPIGLSILYGFLVGFSASTIIFGKLHVLTFVFSTTLIGISLDYSLHYFLTSQESGFKKSLTCSMLTTVLSFIVLYFSNIEILKQIAIFTSAGLIGVYLFVITMLPEYRYNNTFSNFPKFNLDKFKPYFFIAVSIVILLGAVKIEFDDNVKNLYVPPKNLMEAEKIYHNVFTPKDIKFVITTGKNLDEIIEKQEKCENPEILSLANFVSSRKKQLENRNLVRNLYKNDLDKYASFLNNEDKNKIKSEIQEERIYDVENFPLKSEFMLDENTAFSLSYSNEGISISESITQVLYKIRHKCFVLIPAAFLILVTFLSGIFGIKNALKITASPLIGASFALCLLSLCNIKINMFHILALFLIIGFSLDYSIFRFNNGENSKDAVFMSFISTALSFCLLAFTSFKLISSLGIILFIGILTSYLVSLFMIKSNNAK